MTISNSELGLTAQGGDDLERTEPDFRLEDADLFRDRPDDPEFCEARTDPGGPPTEAFANTLPEESGSRPDPSRDEALLSFLETVRRVFGKYPGEPGR